MPRHAESFNPSVKEIIRNQAGLHLSDTSIEVLPQSSCQKVVIHRIKLDSFHKFNGILAIFLPQFENISATNGCMAAPFCMSEEATLMFLVGSTLLICYDTVQASVSL
jgi:hypothetical protein